MFESFVLCVISFFSAVGIFSALKKSLYMLKSKHEKNSVIILNVNYNENSIEFILRQIIKNHPYSEIIVVDSDFSIDTLSIIKKICKDFSFIYLKEKDS